MRLLLTSVRHGLNFIKLDGDIGCLGMLVYFRNAHPTDTVKSTAPA